MKLTIALWVVVCLCLALAAVLGCRKPKRPQATRTNRRNNPSTAEWFQGSK